MITQIFKKRRFTLLENVSNGVSSVSKCFLIFLVVAFFLCAVNAVYAEQNAESEKEDEEEVELEEDEEETEEIEKEKAKKVEKVTSTAPVTATKSIKGEVEVIRPNYISITYKYE